MKPKKTKKPKKVKGKTKSKKPVVGYYFDGKKSHTLREDHWSTKYWTFFWSYRYRPTFFS
jgi:hypothetical protein